MFPPRTNRMPNDTAAPSSPVQYRLPPASVALWIFLLTLAVRLLVLGRLAASPYLFPESGDMKFYSDWALRIAGGEASDPHAFYGLPGYAYFLALIYWLADLGLFLTSAIHSLPLGRPHPVAVGILQALSEAVVAVLIFKISSLVFREGKSDSDSRRADLIGLIASLGWMFYKPAQTFSTVLMPTTWLVLAFWGLVWWILKTREASVWQPWLWMGLLVGTMAMMIATVLFLVPLVVIAIVLRVAPELPPARRLPRIAGAVCCVIAGIFAGASPCWIHNYFVAREPVFLSAHSGINFYIGNNPLANGYPKIPPGMRAGQDGMLKDSITMAEAAAGHPLTRSEVSRYWSAKAGDFTHNHRREWWKLMATKFKNFWNAFQYDDLSLISLFSQDGIILPGFGFGFLAALAIPGMFAAAFRFPRSRWVLAAVLLHMAALMPVFVTERYRLAAAPGLLLFAGCGLVGMGFNLSAGRWRQPAFQFAGSAAVACLVAQPPKDEGLFSLDFYNTGIKAEEAAEAEFAQNRPASAEKSLERARLNLETAYAYVPQNSEINFALGNLWLKKGDRTKAKQFYRDAININARHSSAYNNLGVLAIEEKRWDLAGKLLTASIEIEPADAKTWYLLAKVRLEQNDRPGAREAIRRARALKPNQAQIEALFRQIEKP